MAHAHRQLARCSLTRAARSLQDLIVRTASTLPEAHTVALAGGGAMIARGFVDRATQDVDLFTEIDDAEARQVCAALRAALRDRGLDSRDADRPPPPTTASSLSILLDGSECIVEVVADGGRLQSRVMLDVGPVLHPDDLAADAGFTTETFLDALNAIKRLSDADWAEDGITPDAVPVLAKTFADWHARLAAAG